MHDDHDRLPEDLVPIAERLRQGRPELTASQLERVSRRVTRPSAGFASQLAVIICLALGVAFSASGTALALSGLSATGTATQRQYPPTPTTPSGSANESPSPTSPMVLGETPDETVGGTQPDETTEGGEVESETASDPAPSEGSGDESEVAPSGGQATRQLAASNGTDELPFTGIAALPVLGMGLSLLLAGSLLRRRTATRGIGIQ